MDVHVKLVQDCEATAMAAFKSLTNAYLEWLDVDLGFQGIEKELASLPGSYAADEGGCMLVAYGGGEPGGPPAAASTSAAGR